MFTTKKFATAAVVMGLMLAAIGANQVMAKKDTAVPGNCGQCAPRVQSGLVICDLVGCNGGCEYACRIDESSSLPG